MGDLIKIYDNRQVVECNNCGSILWIWQIGPEVAFICGNEECENVVYEEDLQDESKEEN